MMRPPGHIPSSTYRLQMQEGFTFNDAAAVVPYLAKLGIGECYVSPIFVSKPGSAHGYDICDHNRINPALGGEADLKEFAGQLHARGMGLVVDFVPNHMGLDVDLNLWWREVLENGPSSPFAKYFDIDWNPVKQELRGKLLLPILSDQYGVTLDSGQLQVEFVDGMLKLRYADRYLPLNPRELRILLRHNLEPLQSELPPDDAGLSELLSILFHLDHMPAYTQSDPVSVAERHREKEIVKRRLAQLAAESPRIRQHIESNVRAFNGVPGNPASFELLHRLLEAQAYRLSSWRTAMHEINYRRFFDINELAGIRVEDAELFGAAHALLFRLIGEGVIDGVRLDHIDGLFDPGSYLGMLEDCCNQGRQPYVVAEKILTEGEELCPDWLIHGTTGYDFLNSLNAIFVDSRNFHEFIKLHARFTGRKRAFRDIVYVSKKLIVTTSMASELKVLAAELNRISESNRHFRDFTLDSLQSALVEVVACFPVYRTYFSEKGAREFDRRNVRIAVQDALRRNPAMEGSVFDFIGQMILPERTPGLPEEEFTRRVRFAMKFQQYTGPVQAKGVEDTAFYRYGPLISLNEVGGCPGRFGTDPATFHQANEERLRKWPLSMLASTTHDTKRGEDARARINVLSELPREWREGISQWARINSPARTPVNGDPAPDRSDEYFYYQALLGAWPPGLKAPDEPFMCRMREYMGKATKEKKVHTSWINPSEEYDGAVAKFVESTLLGTRSRPFLASFLPFQRRVARLGVVNSLSQLILKLASPGVPDFYQGSALWELHLVDPDNRGCVDFAARSRTLDCMTSMLDGDASAESVCAALSEMLNRWEDGRVKQYITAVGTRLRHRHRDLFTAGDYRRLDVTGARLEHVVALGRALGTEAVIAVTTRFPAGLEEGKRWLPIGRSTWSNTELEIPPEWADLSFRDVVTKRTISPDTKNGARLPLARVLEFCPVALLSGRRGSEVAQ